MNVVIVGEKKRAAAWEKHLRKLSTIREVIISSYLPSPPDAEALILLDDSPENLNTVFEAVKSGYHTYLVSKLPVDSSLIKKIYHASEEAEVKVQFSHWPSISPSTQWIRQQLFKPDLIQIKKETLAANILDDFLNYRHLWMDELALIMKWMGGNIHRIETKPILLKDTYLGLSLTLRFEDGAIASLQFSGLSQKEYHQRILSNRNMVFDCNVTEQRVRIHHLNEHGRISSREKTFNPHSTAQKSVVQFITSIQMNKPTCFNPYDALITSSAADRILSLNNS